MIRTTRTITAAVILLALGCQGDAPTAWVKRLRDPNPRVRRAAAETLGQVGREVPGATVALQEALQDSDDRVRSTAAAALRRLNPNAPPTLDEGQAPVRPKTKETTLAPEETRVAAAAEPKGESSFGDRFQTHVWDFGVVPPGTEVRHRFRITNKTDFSWRITNVSKSCACTVGEFSARTIYPGEAASVELGYQARAQEGRVAQSIVVEFGEPQAPLVSLALKGEVRKPLSAWPAALDLGPVAPGTRIRRTLEVRNYTDRDLALVKIESPDWLKIEQRPVESKEEPYRPRQTWELVVQADALPAAGVDEPVLVVRTDSDQIGPLAIPVHRHRKAPLAAVPDALAFEAVGVGKTAQKSLILEVSPELGALTEKDLVLTHDLGEQLDLRVSGMATRNRFLVVGRFRPQRGPGAVEGELTVTTRVGMVSPLRVKVSGTVP
jgi:hypothetical protein